MVSPSDLWVGLHNLGHRGWWSARYAARRATCGWYWKMGYLLWLESWRGPAHRLGQRLQPPPGFASEDFIYGETPLGTAYELLSWAGLQPEEHFCEIGCGRGVTGLVAAGVFQARVTGVEVVPALAQKARWLARALRLPVEVLEGPPYPTADLYFLTPTTWSEENWLRVVAQLEKAPDGSRALVLSQPLPGWRLEQKRSLPFSWGPNRVFLCVKS
ncbi:MAG: class I SAM-dependent methyltransferase [Vulcanimicrobiota bacterium]